MASFIDSLTASGGTESAGFLNDLIAQLWPNISIAGCRMAKEMVEPMFSSMLPGPLAGLHFTKMELGPVPIKVSRVDVIRTANGISVEMDVNFHSRSEFILDASMVPELGVDKIHLTGRLSVLLAPLTNIIPCISAAQISFINAPSLKLDFTGAAEIADCSLIEKVVRKIIIDNIASMAVLPNRFLYKLDVNADYFKIFLPPLGVLRLTVEKATGLCVPKKSGNVIGKLGSLMGIKDTPDCFAMVYLGPETSFRTQTREDCMEPIWNETRDFFVASYDQNVVVQVSDQDYGENDSMGTATISVKELLLRGGAEELHLVREDLPESQGRVSVRSQFFQLVADKHALSSALNADGHDDEVVGLATVLIASAHNLQGPRDDLKPNVKIAFKQSFNTITKTYFPGEDIFNPAFDQSFRVPITKQILANPPAFEITMMNGTEKVGSVELPFEDVLNAEGCVKEDKFDMGSDISVRALISICGLQLAK